MTADQKRKKKKKRRVNKMSNERIGLAYRCKKCGHIQMLAETEKDHCNHCHHEEIEPIEVVIEER